MVHAASGLANAAVSVPPAATADGFQVAQWKTSQGLPANTIKCLHQTRDGYLWVGTDFGVVRFDGLTFTVFDQVNTAAIKDDTCAAFSEDAEGALWVATLDGVLRYRDGQFSRWSTEHGLPHRKAWELCAGPDDALWIWTEGGLARMHQGRISSYGAEQGVPEGKMRRMFCLPTGEMAFLMESHPTTLLVHDPRADCLIKATLPSTIQSRFSRRMMLSREEDYWVGRSDGVHHCHNGQWNRFTTADGLADNHVHRVFVDRRGVVWATTDGEVLHYLKEGRFIPVKFTSAETDPHVNCLADDAEGNLWLGTQNGLFCLIPGRVQTLAQGDGAPAGSVRLLAVGRDDVLWMATGTTLTSLANGQVQSYQTENPNVNNHIGTFYEDKQGAMWVGMNKEGLYRLGGGVLRKVRWLHGQIFSCINEDAQGNLWMGATDGLFHIAPHDGAILSRSTHPALQEARVLQFDRAGNLWVGTYGQGLSCVRDGQVVATYTTDSGLPDNRVFSIHRDARDALWIGTENGLVRYRLGNLFAFLAKQGLPEGVINQILEDEAGYLWLSGLRGIHRVARSALEDVAEGRAARAHFVSFGEADGMLSSETNGEHQPAGGKDSAGNLLFPTLRGIALVQPKAIRDNERVPQVIIERVQVDEMVCYQDGSRLSDRWKFGTGSEKTELILEPGQARVLDIAYTATSFSDPSKVRFRYKLEGLDADWREVEGNVRRALYTNLKPGSYVFQVRACNNHGYWNETGASFGFFLQPSFYQTWPAYVVGGIVLFGLAAGIQSYRLHNQHRFLRLQQQAALDQQRARFARDMHDDIGSSLTQIAILSEVAKKSMSDPGETQKHVGHISTTARAIIDNLSELVWASNPGNDTLDNLASYLREHIVRYFEPANIRCQVDIPEKLPARPVQAEVRRGLFLVFKEALHNIVKHAQATRVDFGLSLEDGQLLLVIADNGNGRGPAFQGTDGAHAPSGSHGLGLPGMHRRIADLGGQFQFLSQPGSGTTIRIRVPLQIPAPLKTESRRT